MAYKDDVKKWLMITELDSTADQVLDEIISKISSTLNDKLNIPDTDNDKHNFIVFMACHEFLKFNRQEDKIFINKAMGYYLRVLKKYGNYGLI